MTSAPLIAAFALFADIITPPSGFHAIKTDASSQRFFKAFETNAAVSAEWVPACSTWPVCDGNRVGRWTLSTATATAFNSTLDAYMQRRVFPALYTYSGVTNVADLMATTFTTGVATSNLLSRSNSFAASLDLGEYMAASNRDYSAKAGKIAKSREILGKMLVGGTQDGDRLFANVLDITDEAIGQNYWLVPADFIQGAPEYGKWSEDPAEAACIASGFLLGLGEIDCSEVCRKARSPIFSMGNVDVIRNLVPDWVQTMMEDGTVSNITALCEYYDETGNDPIYGSKRGHAGCDGLNNLMNGTYDVSAYAYYSPKLYPHPWALANEVLSLCTRSVTGWQVQEKRQHGLPKRENPSDWDIYGTPPNLAQPSAQNPAITYYMSNYTYQVVASARYVQSAAPVVESDVLFGQPGEIRIPFDNFELDTNGVKVSVSPAGGSNMVETRTPCVGWRDIPGDVTSSATLSIYVPISGGPWMVIDDSRLVEAVESGNTKVDEGCLMFAFYPNARPCPYLEPIFTISDFGYYGAAHWGFNTAEDVKVRQIDAQSLASNSVKAVTVNYSGKISGVKFDKENGPVMRFLSNPGPTELEDYDGNLVKSRAYDDQQYIYDGDTTAPAPRLPLLYDKKILSGELYGFETVSATLDATAITNACAGNFGFTPTATSETSKVLFSLRKGNTFARHSELLDGFVDLAGRCEESVHQVKAKLSTAETQTTVSTNKVSGQITTETSEKKVTEVGQAPDPTEEAARQFDKSAFEAALTNIVDKGNLIVFNAGGDDETSDYSILDLRVAATLVSWGDGRLAVFTQSGDTSDINDTNAWAKLTYTGQLTNTTTTVTARQSPIMTYHLKPVQILNWDFKAMRRTDE